MRRIFWILALAGLAAGGVFVVLTSPATLAASELPEHMVDLKNGELIFHVGGCGSCHAAPDSEDETRLGGGRALETPFGTFRVPNISPDPEAGIGGWSDLQFVNAMMRGVSPAGEHYYPAFPYLSYQRMAYADVLDLKAYIDTLPAVKTKSLEHDLPLPFRLRRGIGLWKLLYLDEKQFHPDPKRSEEENRGAYLVLGPGHCGECHTPRDRFGGFLPGRLLAGGPAPEGEGFIPNITPDPGALGAWSAKDIAYALESGFTPDFDSLGGTMVPVLQSLAKIPADERAAIAAYLVSIPPIPPVPKVPGEP